MPSTPRPKFSPRTLKRLFVEDLCGKVDRATGPVLDRERLESTGWDDLNRVISALSSLVQRMGGQKEFAEVVAAALKDPDITTGHRHAILAALMKMQAVAEEAGRQWKLVRHLDERDEISQMTDRQLAAELRKLTAPRE